MHTTVLPGKVVDPFKEPEGKSQSTKGPIIEAAEPTSFKRPQIRGDRSSTDHTTKATEAPDDPQKSGRPAKPENDDSSPTKRPNKTEKHPDDTEKHQDDLDEPKNDNSPTTHSPAIPIKNPDGTKKPRKVDDPTTKFTDASRHTGPSNGTHHPPASRTTTRRHVDPEGPKKEPAKHTTERPRHTEDSREPEKIHHSTTVEDPFINLHTTPHVEPEKGHHTTPKERTTERTRHTRGATIVKSKHPDISQEPTEHSYSTPKGTPDSTAEPTDGSKGPNENDNSSTSSTEAPDPSTADGPSAKENTTVAANPSDSPSTKENTTVTANPSEATGEPKSGDDASTTNLLESSSPGPGHSSRSGNPIHVYLSGATTMKTKHPHVPKEHTGNSDSPSRSTSNTTEPAGSSNGPQGNNSTVMEPSDHSTEKPRNNGSSLTEKIEPGNEPTGSSDKSTHAFGAAGDDVTTEESSTSRKHDQGYPGSVAKGDVEGSDNSQPREDGNGVRRTTLGSSAVDVETSKEDSGRHGRSSRTIKTTRATTDKGSSMASTAKNNSTFGRVTPLHLKEGSTGGHHSEIHSSKPTKATVATGGKGGPEGLELTTTATNGSGDSLGYDNNGLRPRIRGAPAAIPKATSGRNSSFTKSSTPTVRAQESTTEKQDGGEKLRKFSSIRVGVGDNVKRRPDAKGKLGAEKQTPAPSGNKFGYISPGSYCPSP
ncbi:hypothetical protein TELCIR_09809 [Teladorsagia circumcincta]|uniref:Uncharacterized protein n=1 Tax=Teladorsagia circumcincta TaxID=45464 RepID=A0A2G9UE25_TELCI|nr:hypothetical protein TELCIR_09809 [Teladorsagia circumcincta]